MATRHRICLLAGQFDVTLAASYGLAAWSRRHDGWRIEVVSSSDPVGIGWLADAGYGGVIAVGPSDDMQQALRRLKLPSVAIQAGATGILPVVNVDDRAIAICAAEHLLGCGYRRLAFYGVQTPWSEARFHAFAEAVRRQTPISATNARNSIWPRWNDAQQDRHVRAFLRKLQGPTAVMACNDLMARVLADGCADLRLNIPDDVAIVGVDNSESLCESDQVTLSSVDPDLERLGEEAGRLLHAAGGRRSSAAPVILVPPRGVTQRRSTNPAAFDDPEIAAAIRYIRETACEGITVQQVCTRLSVSRRQFERRCFAALGHLPGEEIRRLRIARARDLLTNTRLSLTQIALRCGYAHLSSFSAAYHQATGQPPSAARKP